MGVKVYYIIVAAVLLFALLLPQDRENRKKYIITMFLLHTFVCAFRYRLMHGDLMKYANYFSTVQGYDWLSDHVFSGGRNFGFYWIMKLVAHLTGGQFQYMLILIAVLSEAAVAHMVFRYSEHPWLSYLMWNCIGFYIFGFYALKQILAMALLVPAFDAILEEKPRKWLFWTLLASTVHLPALVFLLSYPVCKKKMDGLKLLGLLLGIALVYRFRAQIVEFMVSVYYDEDREYLDPSGIGGRMLMMLFMLMLGLVFKGFRDERFSKLFSLVVIAAALQLFSRFGNIFTRLSDYYFQFAIIYVPAIFGSLDRQDSADSWAILRLHPRLKHLAIAALVLFALWFYRSSSLSDTSNSVDNLCRFRFLWEVGS